jgi:hypothetical protein
MSLMVTGKPWWDDWSPNDKELSIGPLSNEEKFQILKFFKRVYHVES